MTMNCRKNLEYAVAGKQPRANRPASMGRGRLQRQQTLVHLDDVVGQTVGRDGSLVQKNGAVAVLRDLGHVMGHHKDGFTRPPKIPDAFEELVLKSRVPDGEDFVDHQDLWVPLRGDRKSTSLN